MKPRTFGERLTFAQQHSGMTMRTLATRSGIQLAVLEAEEKAGMNLPVVLMVDHLTRLCKLLNVSWAWLVEGDPTPRGRAAADRMRISGATFLDVEELERACDLLEALP